MDMTFFLKYHDTDDDIRLFSHQVVVLGQMVLNLEKKACRVELKINTAKPNDLSGGQSTLPSCINGQNIKGIDQFIKLVSIVFAYCHVQLDAQNSKGEVWTISERS